MEKIIDPVDVNLLKAELTEDRLLCKTNKAGNLIYVVDCHNAPNVLREVGRLREISFREAGGSSGLSMDIDEFDTMEKPYSQIVVWDPDAERIIGGYRYILGTDVVLEENGQPHLATAHMFRFSEKFMQKYLAHTIELGRSFVTPDYQSSKMGAKSIFSLDNLWDGIIAIVLKHPDIHYIFGKFTMYPSYSPAAKDLILRFYWKHFEDKEKLVEPYVPMMPVSRPEILDLILHSDEFKEDYRLLKEAVRKLGTNIPPLVNSYMNISLGVKMFGTAINDEFSNVDETGILVDFSDINVDKIDRHVNALLNTTIEKAKRRFPGLKPEFGEKLRLRWFERKNKRHKILEK
ncbi:MAG: GNAT family N-acetyltransferase [Bacteroidales bacterium]|nr:GNAT family N-acetyltransferase [Candidatus Cryptobacteroides equifaecalis]